MDYKEKHAHRLRRALGAAVLAATMVVPVGCVNKKEKPEHTEKQGLLNPTPLETHDNYNENVTLYLVNLPIYKRDGERKKDQYILTRGLKGSEYKAPNEKRFIRKAFFNGSDTPVFVLTTQDGAIPTEDGRFVGLFIGDDNKVIVVTDDHIQDYIKDHTIQKNEARNTASSHVAENISKVRQEIAEKDSLQQIAKADTLNTDTATIPSDSLQNSQTKSDIRHNTAPDTLNVIHQSVRE